MTRRPLPIVLSGIALMAAPMFWTLLQTGVYVGNGTDLYSYQLPMRDAARSFWAEGRLLTWNPYLLAGVETHAGMQLGLLYPPNAVASLLFGAQASSVLFFVHLLVGGAGAACLGRLWLGDRWIASVWGPLASAAVWLGSGQTWGHLWAGHVAVVETWALWPWVWAVALAAIRRRSLVLSGLAGAVLAMQILAGYPQITFLCGIGLLPVILHEILSAPAPSRTPTSIAVIALGGLMAAVASLLAAAQLLPTAAFASTMNRSLATPLEIAQSFSAPAYSLYSFLSPHVWGGPGPRLAGVMWHETAAFFGGAALALAVLGTLRVGARSLIFVAFMLLFALLSVGEHSPVMAALVEVVPPLGSFRVPGRWLMPLTALAVLLVAEAANAAVPARVGAPAASKAPLWHRIVMAAPGLLALWLAWSLDSASGWWGDRVQANLAEAEPLIGTIRAELTLTGAFSILAASFVRSSGAWLPRALVVMACLEALMFAGSHVGARFRAPVSATAWSPADVAAIREAVDGEHRLATAAALRHADWGARVGVRVAGGYEPAVTRETNWYGNRLAGRPIDGYAVNFQVRGPSPWLDRMAVSHALVDPLSAPAWQAWTPVSVLASGLSLRRNPAPLSRIAWAEDVQVDADVRGVIARLQTSSRNQTILSEPLPHAPNAGTKVAIERDDPDALDVTTESTGPCVLIVRDAWASGWSARVDGRPAPIARADGLFRAVSVPAGRHRVHFRFEAPGLRVGLWVSAIAWSLLIPLLVWRRRDLSLKGERAL